MSYYSPPPQVFSSFQIQQAIQRNLASPLRPLSSPPLRPYCPPAPREIEYPSIYDSRFVPLRTAEPDVKPYWEK